LKDFVHFSIWGLKKSQRLEARGSRLFELVLLFCIHAFTVTKRNTGAIINFDLEIGKRIKKLKVESSKLKEGPDSCWEASDGRGNVYKYLDIGIYGR